MCLLRRQPMVIRACVFFIFGANESEMLHACHIGKMHDLAVRNQDDALAPGEKEELYAYAKAGSLLSILKSKARRTLKVKPKRHNP